MPHVEKVAFHGDPNIGLYGIATDRYAVFPDHFKVDHSVLNVPCIFTKVSGINFAGMFLAGNSNGLLVSSAISERELDSLKKQMEKIAPGVKVEVIDDSNNVLGNLIVCNDKGAVISGALKKHASQIEKALKVPVIQAKVLETDLVGSFCIATNRGFLLTINAQEEEYKFFRKHLKVDGDIGSVNFGGIFVKSGIIANSNGFLVGNMSTGPEIGRMDESLGFV